MEAPWRKIAIIGGTGKMGSWFARQFSQLGFEVYISSRSHVKARRTARKLGVKPLKIEEVAAADLVLLSTPIPITPELALKVAGFMRRGAVLADIASIKTGVVEALEKAVKQFKVKAVSLHPMFGPGAESLKGQRIIVIPVKGSLSTAKLMAGFLRAAGSKVVVASTAALHDKMMALTLALPHFLNILFGATLTAGKIPVRKLGNFAGTTFQLQKVICESVSQEDPETYASIQMFNPYFLEVLNSLLEEASKLKEAVEKGSLEKIVEVFRRVSGFLAEDPEYREAYKRFYAALKALSG